MKSIKNKRMSIIATLLCLGLFSLGLFGLKKDVLVKVGGEVITEADLNARIATFPPQLQQNLANPEAREQLLNSMIDELILIEVAEDEDLDDTDEFEAQMEVARRQILLSLLMRDKVENQVTVTDEEINAYYKNNAAQFKASQQRRASHILVASKAKANKIRTSLRNGANFEKAAAKNSTDPGSKNRGGDLGWFEKGQLVPEFEKAAYALKKKGDISAVVKSQFGYHIIRLDGKKVRPAITFDQAKEQIRQLISGNKKQTISKQFLDTAKKEVKIKRPSEKKES